MYTNNFYSYYKFKIILFIQIFISILCFLVNRKVDSSFQIKIFSLKQYTDYWSNKTLENL
jgi:hypothetical protein